jgi:hypothetical protein
MKVKAITYGRTVSKDFQSRRAEYTIELEEGEDPGAALSLAKAMTDHALGLSPSEAEIQKARDVLDRAEAIKVPIRR